MPDDRPLFNRLGYYWAKELPPSYNRHYLPVGGGHQLTNECWCKPLLQNDPAETIVIHNDRPVA